MRSASGSGIRSCPTPSAGIARLYRPSGDGSGTTGDLTISYMGVDSATISYASGHAAVTAADVASKISGIAAPSTAASSPSSNSGKKSSPRSLNSAI